MKIPDLNVPSSRVLLFQTTVLSVSHVQTAETAALILRLKARSAGLADYLEDSYPIILGTFFLDCTTVVRSVLFICTGNISVECNSISPSVNSH